MAELTEKQIIEAAIAKAEARREKALAAGYIQLAEQSQAEVNILRDRERIAQIAAQSN